MSAPSQRWNFPSLSWWLILTRVPLASVQWRRHCWPHVGQMPMDPRRVRGACMGWSLAGTDSLCKPVFEEHGAGPGARGLGPGCGCTLIRSQSPTARDSGWLFLHPCQPPVTWAQRPQGLGGGRRRTIKRGRPPECGLPASAVSASRRGQARLKRSLVLEQGRSHHLRVPQSWSALADTPGSGDSSCGHSPGPGVTSAEPVTLTGSPPCGAALPRRTFPGSLLVLSPAPTAPQEPSGCGVREEGQNPGPARPHAPACSPVSSPLWSRRAEDFVQGPRGSAIRAERGAAVSSGSHKEEEKQSSKSFGRKEGARPPEPGRPWNSFSSARESCVYPCPNPGASGHRRGLSAWTPSPRARQWLWQKLGICLGSSVPRAGQEHGSAPGSAHPVPEGAARGLGVASDSGSLGTSRPRSARPGAVVAVEETDVCWHRSAPGQRGRLHPSPLKPAHASVLGSCEPLCEGRSSDATDGGTVVRLGSQDASLAATPILPQCTLGRVVRSCKNASDHLELPLCVSSKSELVKYVRA